MFFLYIFAALIVFLIALYIALKLIVRRFVHTKLAQYQSVLDTGDPKRLWPVRIRIRPASPATAPDIESDWAVCLRLGYQLQGDFEDEDGYFALRIGVNSKANQFVALLRHEGTLSCLSFFVDKEGNYYVFSNFPHMECQGSMGRWEYLETSTSGLIENAFHRAQKVEIRSLNSQECQMLLEQAYGDLMESSLFPGPKADDFSDLGAFDFAQRLWSEQVKSLILYKCEQKQLQPDDDWLVVHEGMGSTSLQSELEAIFDWPDIETEKYLTEPLIAQGYSGLELFKQMEMRAPVPFQLVQVVRFDQPIKAEVFRKTFGRASIARPIAYEATNGSGQKVQGVLLALDTNDAKAQLDRMQLVDTKVHFDSFLLEDEPLEFQLETMIHTSQFQGDSIGRSVIRSLSSQVLIWLPPMVLLIWSLRQHRPMGLTDWAIFVYAGMAACIMVGLIGPMVCYHFYYRSRLFCHWSQAQFWLNLLKILPGPAKKIQTIEQCVVWAGGGQLDRALTLWNKQRSHVPEREFLAGLVRIYDHAGDDAKKTQAMRQAYELDPANSIYAMDLALSLAKQGQELDFVKEILDSVSIDRVSELVKIGHLATQGYILAHEKNYDSAMAKFHQANNIAHNFTSPLIYLFIVEMQATIAILLKKSGRINQAEKLWNHHLRFVQRHKSMRFLIDQYQRA
ncbi:MAG: hypothetical protein KDC71_10365 [Acidobacteria bacterium]|nr:hypothetical protein [Acidobacteriota bacterium]